MAKPYALPREEVIRLYGLWKKDAIGGSFIAEAACVKDWFELGEGWGV
jgi:hypothetical protein